MKDKRIFAILAALSVLPFLLFGAPINPPQRDNLNATLNQLRSSIVDLKNTVQNHESEIRTFEEKLHTQESSFETLRDQLVSATEELQVQTKNNGVNLEGKISTLENSLNGFATDIRQMKTQANDTVTAFTQLKQKLADMEKVIDAQNQHMGQLEAALKSMMAAIQGSNDVSAPPSAVGSGAVYKVQSGDTLDKIAKRNNVTLKALKDANPQITSDKIVVGQSLKIP